MLQFGFYHARVSMSIAPTIVKLGLLLCLLGLATAYQDVGGRSCQKNGERCQTHAECCSHKCMTYLSTCAKKIDDRIPIPHTPGFNGIFDVMSKPSADHVKVVGLSNLPDPSKETYDIVPQPKANGSPAPQCQNVGGPCNSSVDCCNLRCHFYMHRCVT